MVDLKSVVGFGALAVGLVFVQYRRKQRNEEILVLKKLEELYRERAKVHKVQHIPHASLMPNNKELFRLGIAEGHDWKGARKEFEETHRKTDGQAKMIYMIRHGEGEHNVAERVHGSEKWENEIALGEEFRDACLNEVGIQQCMELHANVKDAWGNGLEVDVIIVSPLTRAIETAKHTFAHVWGTGDVPIIAVEMCRERFGKNQCDMRKSVSELKQLFPEVNFDHFMESEHDSWFRPERETDHEIEKRVAQFFSWLSHTPWKSVAIVGHSSYMSSSVKYLGGGHHWPSNCELVTMVVERAKTI